MVHTLRLDNYSPTPRKLVLGTNSSFGTESIKIERGAGWDGLNLTATWHIPGREEPLRVALLDGDAMDVPPEVTKEAKDGVLVLAGLASGVQRASCNVDYLILEQAGVYGGADAEPTPELAAQVLEAALQAKADAEAAAEEAAAAKARAEEAQAASAAAKEAAEAAAADAAKAGPYAEAALAAQRAAEAALDKAITAQQAAEIAAQAAQEAQAAAAAARDDAVKAQTAAQTAAKSAQDAQAAAEKARDDAKAAQKGAEDARDAAAGSAEAAAKSEANAKQSADTLAESVENVAANTAAVAELKENKAEIDDTAVGANAWSSKHIVDMLCPPLEESGNPVVCYPVVGYPLGVKASWKPVQEGSGTPYPAGGGKNQLNPAKYEAATKTINGITFTRLNAGEVIVNGTATGTAIYVLIANFSYLVSLSTDRNWSIAGENVISAQGLVSGVTVSRPSDNTSLYIRVQSGTTVKTTVQPQIEKGNTPTAWEPYENIRPIKGRDSVTVERCGENLLNIKPFNKFTKNGITYEYVPDGGIHISGTATTTVDSSTFPVWHLPPGKYYGLETGEGISASVVVQRNGKNLWLNAKGNFEILAGDVTKYWYAIVSAGATVDKTVYPYIVPGTIAPTTYTPYIGSTTPLTLPETVYGGEVDAVTGEGQKTWSQMTLDGTENYIVEEPKQYSVTLNEISSYGLCSHYKSINSSQLQNHVFGVYLSYTIKAIFNTNFSSLDEFKQYLMAQFEAGTPIQICYTREHNTPNPTFTATGGVPIKAFSGTNTVLTDADSATVTGRADPIKRITDLEDAVASQT